MKNIIDPNGLAQEKHIRGADEYLKIAKWSLRIALVCSGIIFMFPAVMNNYFFELTISLSWVSAGLAYLITMVPLWYVYNGMRESGIVLPETSWLVVKKGRVVWYDNFAQWFLSLL